MNKTSAGEIYRLILGTFIALTIMLSTHLVSAAGTQQELAQVIYDEATIERFVEVSSPQVLGHS
jgi:hypothetical protein